MSDYDGTQIGADGKRHETGSQELADAQAPKRQHYQVHGTPVDGDTVYYNAAEGRLEFISVDDLAAYTPST